MYRTIEQFVPITSSQQDLLIVTEGFNDEALYFGASFDSVKPGMFYKTHLFFSGLRFVVQKELKSLLSNFYSHE